MREISIVVSKNDTRQFSSEAHFMTTLPVSIPAGQYKCQVFKMGEGAVSALRILLVDESIPERNQQALL